MAVINMPDVCPMSCDFRLEGASQSFQSELSGVEQVGQLLWSRWGATLQFPPLRGTDAGKMRAFLVRLGGRSGMFRMPAPGKRAGSALGTPLIASVTSSVQLETEGWAPNQPLALDVGDYITIGNELKMIAEPAAADAFGRATLNIAPPLRRTPAVGAPVVVDSPSCIMRLADDRAAWGITAPSLYAMTIDCIEVLDV